MHSVDLTTQALSSVGVCRSHRAEPGAASRLRLRPELGRRCDQAGEARERGVRAHQPAGDGSEGPLRDRLQGPARARQFGRPGAAHHLLSCRRPDGDERCRRCAGWVVGSDLVLEHLAAADRARGDASGDPRLPLRLGRAHPRRHSADHCRPPRATCSWSPSSTAPAAGTRARLPTGRTTASSRTSAACTSPTERPFATSLPRARSSPSGARSGRTGRPSPPTPTSTTTSSPSSARTGSRSRSSATCSAGPGSASPTSSRAAYIHSVGAQEQLWGCRSGAKRLTALSNCFFPTLTELERDEDGTDVLPVIETPWYRFGDEGRKRIRFAYTSYDCRATMGVPTASATPMAWRGAPDNEGQVLDPFDENAEALAALQQMLEVGYIRNPTDTNYTVVGRLPETQDYAPLPPADLQAPLRHGFPGATDRALLRHAAVWHGRRGSGR